MITKYKFTDETKVVNGHILHRIQALKKIGDVKKGDLGGWIEKEENLSQEGKCWVYDDAKVYENARVYGDAKIYDKAKIFENALLMDKARVYGNSRIFGNAEVYGNSEILNDACVFDNARIYDNALIYDNAHIFGDAKVFGVAEIIDNAEVSNIQDYIVFKNSWSSGRYFTWTRSNNMWRVGCFYGTGKELIEKAYNDSEESGRKYEKCVNFAEDLNK